MRGIIIVLAVMLAGALAAGVYVILEGRERVPQKVSKAKTIKPGRGQGQGRPTSSDTVVGPGNGGFFFRVDQQGNITAKFRTDSWQALPDGRYTCANPEMIFYMHNGQVLRIRGTHGEVFMQEGPNRNKNVLGSANMTQQPRSGKLYDVMLEMFNKDTDETASVTLTMPNAGFEAENVRIATQQYEDATGKIIPANAVPVHVRGEDYEFDGYGLVLQYSDTTRRLELLVIDRGERLLIKHPRKFLESRPTSQPATVAVNRDPIGDAVYGIGPLWIKGQPLRGVELAAADRGAARAAARPPAERRRTPPRPTSRPRPVHNPAHDDQLYRATFTRDVEIFQAGQRIATADEMQILCVNAQTTRPTTKPAGTSELAAPSPRSPLSPVSRPSGLRGGRGGFARGGGAPRISPATRPSTFPTTLKSDPRAPTTAPSPLDQEVLVLWKGPLQIEPIIGTRPEGLVAGEAIVKLTAQSGKAVNVVRESEGVKNHLRCAALTFWTIDHRARLEGSQSVPVEMFDDRGNIIVSERMDLAQDDGFAQVGPGYAKMMPDDADMAGRKEPMSVSWADRCVLYFLPGDSEQIIIRRAELDGAVEVHDPQLSLNADGLDLLFDTSAIEKAPTTRRSSPPLSQLRANGHVKCNARGPAGDADVHDIECENLDLYTARGRDGKLFAHTLVAVGNVKFADAERKMNAGLVSAILGEPETKATTRATTRRARQDVMPGNLQQLVASGNVHVDMIDGTSADCSTMEIHSNDGRTTAILTTLERDRKSVVRSKDGRLVGPIIRMVQETQELSVDGAGEMDGVYKPDPQAPARPVHIAWTKGIYGHEDVYDCVGNAALTTTDTDGAVNVARGETITLTTTRPTTRATAGKKATTRRSGELAVMDNRTIQSLELKGGRGGKAVVQSDLAAADGSRNFQLESELIQFFQPSENEKRLIIPASGRMWFFDTRAPDKNAPLDDNPLSLRGRTAFSWKKSLIYEQSTSEMIMLGDVTVGRMELDGDKPLQIHAEKIVATVEPATTRPTTQPTTRTASTRPTTRPGGLLAIARVELKKVHIEGTPEKPVRIVGGQMNASTPVLDYDPATHLIVLRGTEDNPVIEYDERGMKAAECEELVYNTVTAKIVGIKKLSGTMRK